VEIKASRLGNVFAHRISLAGQYLILQLLIIAVVLAGVVVVSLTQSTNNFEKIEGRRSLSAAESLASNPLLRALIPSAAPEMGSALPAMAETTRSISGLQFVILADRYGTVITSTYPDDVGTSILHPESKVEEGRGWTGEITRNGNHVLIAQVPVLDDTGQMVGIVSAGQSYPSTRELIQEIAPSALSTLIIAVVLALPGRCCFRAGSGTKLAAWNHAKSQNYLNTAKPCCMASRRALFLSPRIAGSCWPMTLPLNCFSFR